LIEQNKEVKRLKTEVGSWKTEVKELKEAKVEAEKEVERLKGIEEKYEAQQSVLIDLMKRIERLETNN
jgi:predicted RNase H-like nuclease (RuvC/YqgF family)